MISEATFTIESNRFPLGSIFETLETVSVELERVIPINHGTIPYFWVIGTGVDDVIDEIESHPGIEEVELLDRAADQSLFRCTWVLDGDTVLRGIVETDISLLKAVGTTDGWTFWIRSETPEALSAFQSYCVDHGIDVTVTSVHGLQPLRKPAIDLTASQRETLVTAFEKGYFDSPRRATLEAVATEFDISPQAVGSRLRRGTRRLVEQTLITVDYREAE